MSRRRMARSGALVLLVVGGWAVYSDQVGTDTDVVRLVLLVVLAVLVGGLALDSLGEPSPVWRSQTARPTVPRGQDLRTTRYLSLLESHLDARYPDQGVRDRLCRLADVTLSARHGVSVASERGAELLGAELNAIVHEPPRRLTRAEIERSVQRIESL